MSETFHLPIAMTLWVGKFFLQWDWTDWLGISVVILIVLFVWLAVHAIRSGARPLTVLTKTADPVRAAFRAHRN
jgi:hypothetical protein